MLEKLRANNIEISRAFREKFYGGSLVETDWQQLEIVKSSAGKRARDEADGQKEQKVPKPEPKAVEREPSISSTASKPWEASGITAQEAARIKAVAMKEAYAKYKES
eukprot:gene6867-5750_t